MIAAVSAPLSVEIRRPRGARQLPFGRQREALAVRPARIVLAARRVLVAGLLALLGGAAFWGCPGAGGSSALETTPPLTTDDPDAEADLRAADRAAEEGQLEEAARLYRAFLADHPTDPLAPLAELGLGRTLLLRRDQSGPRDAIAHLERAAASSDFVVAERARLYRGAALAVTGRHAEALEALRPLRGRTVDPADTALLLWSIADASIASGDRIAALDALDTLVAAGTGDEDERLARSRIEAISVRELPDADVDRAYDALSRDGASWPQVALRALRAAYDRADVARVRAISDELRARDIALGDELAALVLRADRIGTADPRVIGAILPLSGRGREIGQRAMQGLMLAANTPPDAPPPPDAPQLVFRDDAGDPERAARAVEELVSSHRAIAIIGPLESRAAQAAAQRAQQLGIPLIALAPAEDVTSAGPMAFRLFPSTEGELRELVRAARARGARRFAILHPDLPHGAAIRTAMARLVPEEGGELAASASYAAGATSFGPEVQAIAASGADAILIADSGRQLALIAPALAAGGLWSAAPAAAAPARGRRVTVIVPSFGFDARLARSASRYLQGALFSAPFHAATSHGEGRRFTDGYMARYASEPEMFAAYAYDAFWIVRRAVQGGATTRNDLARALSEEHETPTAGASTGLGSSRSARRATRLLELRGELFEPVP